MFPPVPASAIDAGYEDFANRWNPILDVFEGEGVRFAHEVHPGEIAYDYHTSLRALEAIGHRDAFGFNWDPSHMMWQHIDPVAFITDFADRIYHVDCKDTRLRPHDGRRGVLGSHLPWGDMHRSWDFVSTGHGDVPWEDCFRALRAIGYTGPHLHRVGGRRDGPAARRGRSGRVRPCPAMAAARSVLRRRIQQPELTREHIAEYRHARTRHNNTPQHVHRHIPSADQYRRPAMTTPPASTQGASTPDRPEPRDLAELAAKMPTPRELALTVRARPRRPRAGPGARPDVPTPRFRPGIPLGHRHRRVRRHALRSAQLGS